MSQHETGGETKPTSPGSARPQSRRVSFLIAIVATVVLGVFNHFELGRDNANLIQERVDRSIPENNIEVLHASVPLYYSLPYLDALIRLEFIADLYTGEFSVGPKHASGNQSGCTPNRFEYYVHYMSGRQFMLTVQREAIGKLRDCYRRAGLSQAFLAG